MLIVAGSAIGMLALAPLIYSGGREFFAVVEKGSFFYGDLNLPKWPGRLLFLIGMIATFLRLAELTWRDGRTVLAGGVVSDEQQHAADLLAEKDVLGGVSLAKDYGMSNAILVNATEVHSEGDLDLFAVALKEVLA